MYIHIYITNISNYIKYDIYVSYLYMIFRALQNCRDVQVIIILL